GNWIVTSVHDVPDGKWTFDVVQTRAGSPSAPTSFSMVIDTIALPPTMDALPSDPLVYLPTLTGTAEPSATVVLLSATGIEVANGAVSAEGMWSITLPDGDHDGDRLTATQTDEAGNVSLPSEPTATLSF